MNTEGMGVTAAGQAAAAATKRIYELAKELGLENKDMVAKVQSLGIQVKNHMSSLAVEDVARVKRALDKERHENLVQERINDTVIRRRTKDGTAVRATPPVPTAVPHLPAGPGGTVPTVFRRAPASAPSGAGAERPTEPHVEARRGESRPGEVQEPETHERVPSHAAATPATPATPATIEAEQPAAHARAEKAPAPAGEAPAGEAASERSAAHAETGVAESRQAPASTQPPAPSPSSSSAPPVEARPEPTPRMPEVRPAPASDVYRAAAEYRAEPTPSRDGDRSPAQSSGASAEDRSAASAAPGSPEGAPRREEVRLGPTGRVIDLPHLRQPVFQVTEQPRGARTVRDLSQKRDLSGRDRFAAQKQHGRKKAAVAGKKQKTTLITTPAQHKRVIEMDEAISVSDMARQMSVKATDVLKKLWSMGMTGITLNTSIDQDTATIVGTEFGFEVKSKAFVEADVFGQGEDAEEDLVERAPVVTIMGHVDHGKTSLLDAIRDANVAGGEAGGITQHIGAYKVTTASGNEVVFLDTPGHEAFTAMRARGAQATDIVVLVVAADDGVMPQTVEALQHAKLAEVPIIVAVNKIDKPGAQPDRIRQQLSAHGLTPEAWGGETIYVDVSARTRLGIDDLLENIAVQSEVLELRANPTKLASGLVIEAKLDRNRGPLATVLVQGGTLKAGDTVVAGEHIGKVRAMLDDKGRQVSAAGPATPVEILGLGGVPNAGETFNAVADEKAAKELVEHRRDQRRKKELAGTGKISLENILDKIKAGDVKELRVVLKADVQGSSEALRDALLNLTNEQVKVDVISSGVGGITETDVNLAKAGAAIIVGFHVRPAGKAAQLAEQEQVDIKLYDIIYEALDDVKKAMAGLLAPVKREKALGKAEVRQVFTIPKVGTIAGCGVTEGLVKRSAQVRLVRDSVTIMTGRISSLRRFKDDVREVQQGYECGIGIENYSDLKEGDVIEAFEIEEIAPTLA